MTAAGPGRGRPRFVVSRPSAPAQVHGPPADPRCNVPVRPAMRATPMQAETTTIGGPGASAPATPALDESAVLLALARSGLLAVAALQDGRLAYASTPFLALFGLEPSAGDADRMALVRTLEEAAGETFEAGKELLFHCTVQTFDGTRRELEIRGERLEPPSCAATVLVAHDVTRHRQDVARLSFLALHDPLTGLSNRALMHDRLAQAVSSADRYRRCCAVLVIDLDGFKAVNDGLGHAAGDSLLREVATRLQACARDSDTVARPGGDEFVLVISQATCYQDAGVVAARVVESLARPYEVDGRSCRIGASVGVAVHPQDGDDADTLLAHADAAMYLAKGTGKNRYAFPDATRETLLALETLDWEEERDTGFHEVDEQHREMVEHMNALATAIREGADCHALAQRLNAMLRFLRRHFATEERLMLRVPGAWDDAHRREHRRLLDDLKRITAVVDEQSVALAVRYLYDWLFRHVDQYDRRLGDLAAQL